MLEVLGHKVTQASSGKEGLKIFEREKFDMVFTPSPLTKLGIIDFRDGKSKNMEEAYKKAGKTLVSTIMKTDLITTTPKEFVKNAAKLMVEKKINRLLVVKDEKLVGIVTRGDIIKGVTIM